jgi:putative addiction module component (TIGR02574 family)
MNPTVKAVADEALKLSLEDREALVETLIASLESEGGLSPEWQQEVARRVADMQAGRSRFIPADEAMRRLAAHIHARRSAA